MPLEVIPASAGQEPVIANLLELYAHDFSEFYDVDLGADGKFGYRELPLYWHDPHWHPFLITTDGKLAGFILVKETAGILGVQAVWDLAEFFIARGYRRRGMGTEAAHALWRRFPGSWEVRVMQSNHAAQVFWERAIAKFAGRQVEPIAVQRTGIQWQVFAFESVA